MRFYLGSHMPVHLTRTTVPLFVSAVRLRMCKRLPQAAGPWSLDSGGFSAITSDGYYDAGPRQYAREVREWSREIGGMQWAAIQDWMCEPVALKRSGKSVAEHLRLTVESYLRLRDLEPREVWTPVVQGFAEADYLRCVDLYDSRGVELSSCPTVGVGSICRRQGTGEAASILARLKSCGLNNLHGFGLKITGLIDRGIAASLASADSMAWSFRGRSAWHHERTRLCGGYHRGGCANCLDWAVAWHDEITSSLPAPTVGKKGTT